MGCTRLSLAVQVELVVAVRTWKDLASCAEVVKTGQSGLVEPSRGQELFAPGVAVKVM
jgi:hypothetical protein